ncbi:MAG: MFS transporter [Melioribacteraceae bacterium]|nr:MFS transporter [Melioribacteraceae bacterium]MCF8353523.1 MFS transporter [Melioribacteraceae bacterium]MCF8392543.1 MFS transporter [Melioribacteraceae bacterium]MCF8418442.1 MFS transporter [Melioribacteraceae bacterium]
MVNHFRFRINDKNYIKRNFFLNVLDGSVFAFGINFVSLTTILPLLVKQIGGTNISVGLIPVIWTMGFNFPQIFIANFTRKQLKKKPVVLKTAFIQRLPWLLLGVITLLFFDNVSPDTGLILFFAGFALAAVGGSVNMPAWFDLVSKVTPVNLRGRLFAVRVTLGAVFGIFAGYIAKQVLDTMVFPESYSLLFFVAFIFMMSSYVFIIFLKEETINPSKQVIRSKDFLLSLPQILRSERNYRNYLISDALMIMAGMSHGFFTVYAFDKFILSPGYAGSFTIVMTLATVFGSILFGFLADRKGHRVNLMFAALFTLTACVTAIIVNQVELYYLVFVFSALTISLIQVSRLTIIAELSNDEERPTYVALTNLITVPFTLIGIAGGVIANNYGYEPVFIISAVFALLAFFWIKYMMYEPRKKQHATFLYEENNG